MATIKVKFRASLVEGQEGTICYQVIHHRVTRQLSTSCKVLPQEWDSRRGNVIIPKDSRRKAHLISVRERIRLDVERLTKIIRRLEDSGMAYTGNDICDEFLSYKDRLSLADRMGKAIIRLKEGGRKSTSINYRNALGSFMRFLSTKEEDDIMLDNMTAELMVDYQAHLQARGVVRNTISFYMRQLRAVYNAAVDEGLIEQKYPFRKVYTGIDKTVKRAIGLDSLARLVSLDLSDRPRLDYSRDMFVLSFYFRGMSFVDMAYLRRDNMEGGYLTYFRHKTGQRLKIKWTSEMQQIVDKYPPNASGYLLPIIRSKDVDEYYTYKNALAGVNAGLKEIGEMLRLPVRLTHYAARHTWASGAQSKGIPIGLISEGMGHDNVNTTRIYLASLDTSEVDSVNDRMIKSVQKH